MDKINLKKLLLPGIVLVLALVIGVVFTKYPSLFYKIPFFGIKSTQPTDPFAPLPPLSGPAFDVPSLVGKEIKVIQQEIGPSLDQQPDPLPEGAKSWRLTFRKARAELVVTYDIQSGKATTFSLASDDPKGKTSDKTRLLKLGNLDENSTSYDVVFVKTAEDPNEFTAIKAITK